MSVLPLRVVVAPCDAKIAERLATALHNAPVVVRSNWPADAVGLENVFEMEQEDVEAHARQQMPGWRVIFL